MTRKKEPAKFFMRAVRYALALMIGTLILVKGLEWIGIGVGVNTRALTGAISGAVVVLVSGSPASWFLELILAAVCFLYLNLPFNSEALGAQIDIAFGLAFGWALSSGFISRFNKSD